MIGWAVCDFTPISTVFQPGRPTYLDCSRARAYCTCSRWCGLFGYFSLDYHFTFLSFSQWETARYRLKYRTKGPLSPKQPAMSGRWVDNERLCAVEIRLLLERIPPRERIGHGTTRSNRLDYQSSYETTSMQSHVHETLRGSCFSLLCQLDYTEDPRYNDIVCYQRFCCKIEFAVIKKLDRTHVKHQ